MGYGRKSGRRHVVKLRFVELGPTSICVLSMTSEPELPNWLRNLLFSRNREAPVNGQHDISHSPLVASKNIFGKITRVNILVDQLEASKVLAKFFQKYRTHSFALHMKRYYANSRPIVIEFSHLPRNDELIRELEFDFQASKYTETILNNEISRWQRGVTVSSLLRIFASGETVLEIGCGTGVETLELSKRGINVVAVDISSSMLEHLHRLAAELGVKGVKTRRLSSSEIADLKSDKYAFPVGGFDGAFSHFGAMNLESNPEEFSENLATILKPGALVSFALWNRYCLSELPLRALKLEMSQVAQRFGGLVRAGEHTKYSLDTLTYTPREFASHFSRFFDLVSYYALPALLIPPSEYAPRLGGLLKLARIDQYLGHLPVLRDLGDNFVMTLKLRKQADAHTCHSRT